MLFLAISFLCFMSFFPVPFCYQLQKWQYQTSENKTFLFFSTSSLLSFHLSFPDLLSLLILLPCKLPFSLFLSPLFFSFFLFCRRYSPGCCDVKHYLSSLRPKVWPRAGCMASIVVVWRGALSTLLRGPSFITRAHCSPSHHPHTWASSSHTDRRTGTCAP